MFLDTSAVIELFLGTERGSKVLEFIKGEDIFISILTYAETAVWCKRNKKDFELWKEKIEEIANIVELTPEICYNAAEITFRTKQNEKTFGIIDGIVLASARSVNQKLISKDKHFRNFEDCIVI
ncbi:MAG: PIN domain-containing protein [Methanomicrobia archaeon]|nr:PIN domain-containing protein [Methanomicrobia archaeon]